MAGMEWSLNIFHMRRYRAHKLKLALTKDCQTSHVMEQNTDGTKRNKTHCFHCFAYSALIGYDVGATLYGPK